VKKIIIIFGLLSVFSCLILADYRTDMANGVKSYLEKDYKNAFKYFSAAYAQQPSPELLKDMQDAYGKMTGPVESRNEETAVKKNGAAWATQENIISFNVLYLLLSTIDVHYERKINDLFSAGINAGVCFSIGDYGGNSLLTAIFLGGGKGYGYNVGAGLSWYPWEKAPNAFYAGLGLVYSYNYSDSVTSYIKTTTYGLGPGCGYRWITGAISFDIAFYYYMLGSRIQDNSDNTYDNYLSSGGSSLNADLGFAF
jgi:hypothetical protein